MNRRALKSRTRVALAGLGLALAASLALPAAAELGEIGSNDYRLSYGDPALDDRDPAVAYCPLHDVYLVVWHEVSAVDSEGRIVARLLAGAGQPVGGEIAPLPSQPCVGGICPGNPAVAYSPTADRFVVVASLDAAFPGQEENEYEIAAFDVDPVTGASSWALLLSDAGGLGESTYDAFSPEVACSGDSEECLVVWFGDDVGGLVANEFEIFGQRLNAATGTAQGANDFRISDMGGTGSGAFDAFTPAVAYAAGLGQYLVAWSGDDNTGGLQNEELEIFAQRLVAATGAETGANDFRVSDVGGTGNVNYSAFEPSVVFAAALGEYLVSWAGDDEVGTLQDDEIEIFGQRFGEQVVFADGFETGNTSAWSLTVP